MAVLSCTDKDMSSKQDRAGADLCLYMPDALFYTRADAIMATDREGIMRIWNAGAVRNFGFATSEVLDRSLDIIVLENYIPSQKGDAIQYGDLDGTAAGVVDEILEIRGCRTVK